MEKKTFSNKVSTALLNALDAFCESNHHAKNDAMAAGLVLFMTAPRLTRLAALSVSKRLERETLTGDEIIDALAEAYYDEVKKDATRAKLAHRVWDPFIPPTGEPTEADKPPAPGPGLRLERGAAGERYRRGRGRKIEGDEKGKS